MEATLQHLEDRAAISETIVRYFNSLDRRDWVGMRATLADQLDLDFSQLFGDPPAILDADAFVSFSVDTLSGFAATQHISSNHVVVVEGDRAEVTASMYAWHKVFPALGTQRILTLRGSYDIGMSRIAEGWRMHKLHMAVWDEDGDTGDFHTAREQWAARGAPQP